MQEQTPVVVQVEDEEVAIASETNNNLSNSNGQTGITSSDKGSSNGFNFILFAVSILIFLHLIEVNMLDRFEFIHVFQFLHVKEKK